MIEIKRYIINSSALPNNYPTHAHSSTFWGTLGRTVATFGFLEEVVCKAIFVMTSTRKYNDSQFLDEYENWVVKLERSLSDPLGNLIDTYGKSLREHTEITIAHDKELLVELRKASTIRNVLCHGSWQKPDASGASKPFFVNKQGEQFDTALDETSLDTIRQHVVMLICEVINTVTYTRETSRCRMYGSMSLL